MIGSSISAVDETELMSVVKLYAYAKWFHTRGVHDAQALRLGHVKRHLLWAGSMLGPACERGRSCERHY